ncbi:MAG: DoxX family protein [Croceitalea sp.]|nr:DoxX family protein [Croceitalea sp.]
MNDLFTMITELILLVFLAIVFLQSGFDKVFDHKGNLSWLKGHFAETPFKNVVSILLIIITLMELLGGFLAVAGLVQMSMGSGSEIAFYAALTCSLTLLMLLLGQRLAKDYAGASTLVIYLVPTVFLLYLLQ